MLPVVNRSQPRNNNDTNTKLSGPGQESAKGGLMHLRYRMKRAMARTQASDKR